MKYEEFINSIKDSRPNVWFEYSERHHIIPRCLGGSDDEDNLIYLTYQEHFRAHVLLSEEYPENEDLQRAVMIMSRNMEIDKEEYAILKKRFSDSQRGNKHFEGKIHTDEWKSNCSNWMLGRKQCLGKIWIHNELGDTLMIDPQYLSSYEEKGWVRGRGSFHTEETKEYCREKSVGRVWINNGSESRMMYDSEDIPEGWRRGRLVKRDEKGRFKFNG